MTFFGGDSTFKDGFKGGYTTIPFAFYKYVGGDWQSGFVAHNHRELELIAVLEGGGDFYVDSEVYTVRAGELLVIPPYCVHRAVILPNTRYDCACFELSLLWDGDLRRELECGDLTVTSAVSEGNPEVAELHARAVNAVAACEGRSVGWEMEVIGNLSILFSRLCNQGFFTRNEAQVREHAFCKAVIEYVDERYADPITSGGAASSLYLNNSYFCRLFRRHFGCSFSEFVNSYRVEKAKFRLNDPTVSISDVAISTGFNSFSYFCKVFKRITGVSPSEYRRSALAG